jgi:hypothetical protein
LVVDLTNSNFTLSMSSLSIFSISGEVASMEVT